MSKVDFVFVGNLQRYHFYYNKNVPKVIGLWIIKVDERFKDRVKNPFFICSLDSRVLELKIIL